MIFDIPKSSDYWDCVLELASIQIDVLRKNPDRISKEEKLKEKFSSKVQLTISNKSPEELANLEKEIEKILYGDQFSMESDYWDFLLMTVKKKRAILTLLSFFQNFDKSGIDLKDVIQEVETPEENKLLILDFEDENSKNDTEKAITQNEFRELLSKRREQSLKLAFNKKLEAVILKRIENRMKAEKMIEKIHKDVEKNIMKTESDNFQLNSRVIEPQLHDNFWAENMRPRKPHFFNRVKLSYEWNKINQNRYTKDNPPPREVRGYKFNIFYPGLIDKSSVPTFKLTQLPNPDFAIITFSAGAPYSKISFKIINQQWDMANRKNFKHLFDKNILHLYFDFAKPRYLR